MSQPRMRFIEGVKPQEGCVHFTFEGKPCTGYVGETIASALMRAGILLLRRTRNGHQARGYYCGMGICWECAVYIEGIGVVRSCTHSIGDGKAVSFADGCCSK